jgi:hypothetical protein
MTVWAASPAVVVAATVGQVHGTPFEGGALTSYGTPTAAPGKVCPFVGDMPVTVAAVTSPAGSSLPGLAGVTVEGSAVPSHVYAELCMSDASWASARSGAPPALLLLVHGITYGTWYWDFPYQPERYSAVNHIIGHGYATLNIDRIGDGRSDHPPSAMVTAASNAEVVHQLIEKLRAGALAGTRFEHVGLVGHSYGVIANWLESAQYNDADMNIGTGYSDRVDHYEAGRFFLTFAPAALVPAYASQPWAADPGYLAPTPGHRGLPQLYYAPNADPQVIATDERLANTVTSGEGLTFPEREYDGTHKNMVIPTFSIQGQFDIMTCGHAAQECATRATMNDDPATVERDATRFRDWQAPAMSSQACYRAAVIPQASHDINLHRDAPMEYAQIVYFADQSMGAHGEHTKSYRSACAFGGPTTADRLPEGGRLIPPNGPYS